MMFGRLLSLTVSTLGGAAMLWLLPARADAVVGAWSTPYKVSADTRHAWFPDVAADDSGNVHIVWTAEYPTPPRVQVDALWYSRTSGRNWTPPTDISLVYIGDAVRNSLAVDSAGRLHLIYKGFGQLEPPRSFDPPRSLGPEDLWYTSTRASTGDSVQAWLPTHQITRGTLGYYADLHVDSHGVLHVIWTEADGLGWGLYYSRSADGGASWSSRVALDDRNYVWWYRAHLKIDALDRLHVTWEVTDRDDLGRTRAAFYARSVDSGRTWSSVQMGGELPREGAPNNVAGPQQPSVGIDGTGQTFFVYRDMDTDRILYRTSLDGARWSTPELIPGIRSGVYRPYDVYDMVTDSAGHVHLAFVGYREGSVSLSLMHAEWDGHGWSAPQVITTGSPPSPEYPKLAVSEGNRLHLVWFGGDRDSIDRLAIGVWYSTLSVAAPRVVNASAAVPLPAIPAPANIALAPVPGRLSNSSSRPVLTASGDMTEFQTDGFANWKPTSSFPLFAAVAAVLLVLGGVGLAAWTSNRRGSR